MADVEIRAYQTHIEVHPYEYGDAPEVELMVSKKSKALHALIPIGYYIDTDTKTLYLPRGINLNTLEYTFKATPVIENEEGLVVGLKGGAVITKPRDKDQDKAIDFLMRRNDYRFASNYSQLALNLPTGFGKTYCTINALVSGKKRAIIICHSKQIRDQWYKGFIKHTSISPNCIMMIDGSKDVQSVLDGTIKASKVSYYIVLHQTLTKVGSENWHDVREFFDKIKVYVKVIDEAHLYFENSLMLDFFSNVPLTYYITATFGRSDPQENNIYKLAYSQVLRYQIKSGSEQHTVSYAVLINSHPSSNMIRYVENGTSFGFSNIQYMKHELRAHALISAVKTVLRNTMNLEGKRLITCNLVEGLNALVLAAQEVNPHWKCAIMTGSSTQEERLEAIDADVICATSKIIGTGSDIAGLRILINTESMASKINIEQLMGRLRPYYDKDGDQKPTVFVHIVDIGFPKCEGMYSRIRSTISKHSSKFFVCEL